MTSILWQSNENFDGELVVSATMEATNDNHDKPVAYSSKKVNARLDFWALFTDDELIMPWGGLKAVKLDINGDGTDEIAVEGIRSRFFERLHRTDSKCYASYKAYPYIALVSMDKSSGKLK